MSGAVEARGLGVQFLFDRQRRVVSPTLARLRRRGPETWGLRGVRLRVEPGEGVGLIGPSGSGKTTLLRAIAGVLDPDAGRISVRGRVGSLLSVQAGLLGPLTGRENALLLGVLAGLTRRESAAALDHIRDYSGLGGAFERAVSSYSHGMRARLGFTVAACADPDVLVLDEVHEALDHEYRAVVERRVGDILASGGVVIAAGHDHHAMSRICRRAIWLAGGEVHADGPFEQVVDAYLSGRRPTCGGALRS